MAEVISQPTLKQEPRQFFLLSGCHVKFYMQKLNQLFHTHALPLKVFPQSQKGVLMLHGGLITSVCAAPDGTEQ